MSNCFSCGESLPEGKVHFNDSCEHCLNHAHVCKNCEFYDDKYNNACREPSAERVVDKDRNNYCEFFQTSGRAGGENKTSREEMKSTAEDLFKK